MMRQGMWIMGAALLAVSCGPKAGQESAGNAGTESVAVQEQAFMPKATVFKMSGPYADRVAVTVDAQGRVTYFPAPGDITKESLPVYLGNGWWLNRQGLGANSVFTSWTMDEYSKLPATPSVSEIKAHIIEGARVTEFERTAVPMSRAMQELGKIRAGLRK